MEVVVIAKDPDKVHVHGRTARERTKGGEPLHPIKLVLFLESSSP